MRRFFSFLLIIGSSVALQAQGPAPRQYPKGYFRNPLDLPLEIVANMGELRPNHWHMGLDIRTDQKVNQRVYAAAGGYISQIGIRPQSFGRFIIINHPNGLSTLYGHLNDFFPALENYVTEQQYKTESWAIELEFSKNQFPVEKGSFIAFSGNTGGSQGPHVHFEIFDTKTEKRLNPLLFGFALKDNVVPSLVKIALYDRSRSVYEQSPEIYSLKKTDSGYIIPKVARIKTGMQRISLAIQAFDRITGSNNADGIFSALLSLDGKDQLMFSIDKVSYAETGYMNAHIDYKHRFNGGGFFQHLSRFPGDEGPVYDPILSNGIIELNDTSVHDVKIEISDSYGNKSFLQFQLQYDPGQANSNTIPYNTSVFVPSEVNILEKPSFELYLPEGSLYDTVYSRYSMEPSNGSGAISGIHRINDGSIPVHDDFTVRIKPDRSIPIEWQNKLVIRRTGRTNQARKAEFQNGWLSAKFGDFGSFQAFVDTEAPQLNELGRADTINLSAASRILFSPTDNFGIKGFRATLNGQWLRFTNDKGRNWIYIFDERCPYGVHHLEVTVEDIAGNITKKSWWFKRGPYTPPKKKAVKKGSKKKKPSLKKKSTRKR